MLAATFHRYGPPSVLSVGTVSAPSPKPNELLIRVRASTVSSADYRVRGMNIPSAIFKPIARLVFGIRRPRQPIPGTELAGIVEEVGADVTGFNPGDPVLASTGARMGANAQLVTIAADGPVAHKPDNLTFEQAAAIPFGGLASLHFLRKANLSPGDRVCINGASGSLGTHAIQIAKHMGLHVTAVCSAANHPLVQGLGADVTHDYRATPIRNWQHTPFDAFFDTIGTTSLRETRHLLKPNARFLAPVMTATELRQSITTLLLPGPRLIGGVVEETKRHLEYLTSLARDGHLRPVVGSTFPLSEIVAAHQLADSGRKVGQAVVIIPSEPCEKQVSAAPPTIRA